MVIYPKRIILDELAAQYNSHDITFTAVGYGLQESFPDAASWKEVAEKVRMVAYPRLIQINTPGFTGDFSMLLSNNHCNWWHLLWRFGWSELHWRFQCYCWRDILRNESHLRRYRWCLPCRQS